MSEYDKQLIAEFLSERYADFQQFLYDRDIEESEADVIINQLESGVQQ